MESNANQTPAYRLDPSMLRTLNRLPREMVEKFSEQELVALYRAMPRRGKHSIDLRFSIPFFPKRLYFVLLIGQDRRQGTRQAHTKPWSPVTTALAMMLTMATLLTLYTVTYRLLQDQRAASTNSAAYPTVLSWNDKA